MNKERSKIITPNSINADKQLLIIGCSARKLKSLGDIPAVARYDGPVFKVLRKFLREYRWPKELSVAVLSAEYGLIGAMTPVADYDRKMDGGRAQELRPYVYKVLNQWKSLHPRIDLVLGARYQEAIEEVVRGDQSVVLRPGPIGQQLAHVRQLLHACSKSPRARRMLPDRRPLYFLPDWDDFLDAGFDFENDNFSAPRSKRCEIHAINLMYPEKICDGVLVSLGQHMSTKGLFRRFSPNSPEALAPRSVREHFNLSQEQLTFADCGAFTYVCEPVPPVTVEQAVALYEFYEFDLGCSVDHIPVCEISTGHGKKTLTLAERHGRVKLTRDNADRFLSEHRRTKAAFIPVGVIQGLKPEDYGAQLGDYLDMGYEVVAFGGLVPRSDQEIADVVQGAAHQLKKMRKKPWIHLLGVFRPRLQQLFREIGIGSFDSATYFRKAWLRSDQNYLAPNGKWFAAIRVPPSHDSRTVQRLLKSGLSEAEIRLLEGRALKALRAYDRGIIGLEECLSSVLRYDSLLVRAEAQPRLAETYRRTLKEKPWQQCSCVMCRQLGIDIVIFRGFNRNKRRGAHNTLMLYRTLQHER